MYSFSSSICSLASLQALYIFPWDQQSLRKIFKALRMAKLHIDEQNHTYFLSIYANDYKSNMDWTSGRYVECQ